jgi:hypothetical protein
LCFLKHFSTEIFCFLLVGSRRLKSYILNDADWLRIGWAGRGVFLNFFTHKFVSTPTIPTPKKNQLTKRPGNRRMSNIVSPRCIEIDPQTETTKQRKTTSLYFLIILSFPLNLKMIRKSTTNVSISASRMNWIR